jgi:hypothetical protein
MCDLPISRGGKPADNVVAGTVGDQDARRVVGQPETGKKQALFLYPPALARGAKPIQADVT